MPVLDVLQIVRSAIESNRGIPAVLDAYGEFVDSPMGALELQSLDEVFALILDNLSQRYPDAASKRAARIAQNDIITFLKAASNNIDSLKETMKGELRSVQDVMITSIAERFRRMDNSERQAMDATLRLVRRSKVDILFRSSAGKSLSSSGDEFQRFFASVSSQSSNIRELRYQNLIVEKGVFNKLILKSSVENLNIWVPSFYAKEGIDQLVQRLGLVSDHAILPVLKGIESSGNFEKIRSFLTQLEDASGILSKDAIVPAELKDFFVPIGSFLIVQPIILDDIISYLREMEAKQQDILRLERERQLAEDKAALDEKERKKANEQRTRARPIEVSIPRVESRVEREDSVYLGKELDFNQLVSALNRRLPENELSSQVKQVGDYFIAVDKDCSIVGSSGSGKSVTLKRIMDGISSKTTSRRLIVIDQKGEHRGVAWKHHWAVFGFVKDSQASELRISFFPETGSRDYNLAADLIQEWMLQSGTNCSDQEKERIASILSSHTETKFGLAEIAEILSAENELSTLAQKLKKNLVMKSGFARIFSQTSTVSSLHKEGSILFDISGRGLRDPTTKEERQMLTVLLLRDLQESKVSGSTIVIEDELDRFKGNSLKLRTLSIVQKLREGGNRFIITSRGNAIEFLGNEHIELLHRLSGEKVVDEVLAGFDTDVSKQLLAKITSFLPRGYLIVSRARLANLESKTTSVRVEQLLF